MEHGIRIADCGDSAVLVRAAGPGDDSWSAVHALADAVEAAGLNGVHGIVPAYDCLLVEFDCAATDHAAVRRAVASAARGSAANRCRCREGSRSRWCMAASTDPTCR